MCGRANNRCSQNVRVRKRLATNLLPTESTLGDEVVVVGWLGGGGDVESPSETRRRWTALYCLGTTDRVSGVQLVPPCNFKITGVEISNARPDCGSSLAPLS